MQCDRREKLWRMWPSEYPLNMCHMQLILISWTKSRWIVHWNSKRRKCYPNPNSSNSCVGFHICCPKLKGHYNLPTSLLALKDRIFPGLVWKQLSYFGWDILVSVHLFLHPSLRSNLYAHGIKFSPRQTFSSENFNPNKVWPSYKWLNTASHTGSVQHQTSSVLVCVYVHWNTLLKYNISSFPSWLIGTQLVLKCFLIGNKPRIFTVNFINAFTE